MSDEKEKLRELLDKIPGSGSFEAARFAHAANTITQTISGGTFHGPVGVNQMFANCFNAVQSLPSGKADLQAAIEELLKAVQALQPHLDEKAQAKVEKNLVPFTKEATAEEPDRSWLEVSGKGLIEAAQTCAKMAAPVVVAVKKVMELFG